MIQTSRHEGLPLHVIKVDIVKAFDRIHKSAMIEAMTKRHVPTSIIQNIVYNWTHETSRIEYAGQCSEPFAHARGTGQGDPTSPILFRWVIEDILDDVDRWIRHWNLGTKNIR